MLEAVNTAKSQTLARASLGQDEAESSKPSKQKANLRDLSKAIVSRKNLMKGVTLGGAGVSFMALLSNLLSSEKSKMRKFVNQFSEWAMRLVFGVYGVMGAVDAGKRNDYKQVCSQILSILIPNVFTRNFDNLTFNRGLDIGLTNIFAAVDKISGSKQYTNISDSFVAIKSAGQKFFKACKNNFLKTILDFDSGFGGVFWGLVTALSPLTLNLTGLKPLAYLQRQAGGIIVEGDKLAKDNLNKNRPRYWCSGLLMLSSSVVNLLNGLIVPKRFNRLFENFTWILNIFGKYAQLEAFNKGELKQQEIRPITASQAVKTFCKDLSLAI